MDIYIVHENVRTEQYTDSGLCTTEWDDNIVDAFISKESAERQASILRGKAAVAITTGQMRKEIVHILMNEWSVLNPCPKDDITDRRIWTDQYLQEKERLLSIPHREAKAIQYSIERLNVKES